MLRKILYGMVGLLVVAAVGVYFLWSPVMTYVVQEQLSGLRARGARIGWKGVNVAGLTVHLDSLEAWIPVSNGRGAVPIQLTIEDISTRPSFWSLIHGDPGTTFSLAGYGGTMRGEASTLSSAPSLSFDIAGVDLGKHPGFQFFGLRSAIIDASLKRAVLNPKSEPEGRLEFKVSDIEIPSLPKSLTIVQVPPITQGVLQGIADIRDGVLNLSNVSFVSSLGEATGSFRVVAPRGGSRKTCEGETIVTLSESGAAFIGPWLPIVSGNVLTAQTKRFKVRLTGIQCSGGRRDGTELVVGDLCIRARYEA